MCRAVLTHSTNSISLNYSINGILTVLYMLYIEKMVSPKVLMISPECYTISTVYMVSLHSTDSILLGPDDIPHSTDDIPHSTYDIPP